jgi:hypothetical protein
MIYPMSSKHIFAHAGTFMLLYPTYNRTRFENPSRAEIMLVCCHNQGVKWLWPLPYHSLWRKDTPTKRIDITPTSTSGAMTRALVLGVLAPQLEIYHTYFTAIFCDFIFAQYINIIVNNNMILD